MKLKNLILILIILTTTGLHLFAKENKEIELLGAGATFPYPLYSKMFDEYYKVKGVKVNYQSIGSGGGVQQIMAKTVDFGASDAFLSDEELKRFDAPVVHIPICLGAVAVTYNLEKVDKLNLTPDVLAEIFLGKITKWNDKKIVELNKDASLPDMNIVVVHRSDGSGTTFIFTDYLSKVSKEWSEKVGCGKAVNWPAGLGAKGNEGVTGYVKQVKGSIGYVELVYALQNNMPVVSLKNKKGKFINPTLKSVSLAANIKNIPDDTRVSITDTESIDGYPISGFTWLILYKEQNYNNRSFELAKELVNLLWWMIHEGQKYTVELNYSPLPPIVLKKAEKIIKSITYSGKPILKH